MVVACGVLHTSTVPDAWRGGPALSAGLIADGGSAIIGPDGRYIAGPVYEDETIVYGEIDLAQVALAKRDIDVAGHYARPDVVRLIFDPAPHPPLAVAPDSARILDAPETPGAAPARSRPRAATRPRARRS